MRTRNRHVSVRMTEQEYLHLKKQAERAGLGIDPFIRKLVADTEIKPRPPEEYAALLRDCPASGTTSTSLRIGRTPEGVSARKNCKRRRSLHGRR